MTYQDFKNAVMGRQIGDGECVSLIVNNSQAYVESLFPGVSWPSIIAPVGGAREMAGKPNEYLQWIANDPNDANQVPLQGDIMIFDATPKAGYSNAYDNPYGHTGICDSADGSGYNLLQQNAPAYRAPVNVTRYGWKYRPTIGWFRPILHVEAPAPTPAPTPVPVPEPPVVPTIPPVAPAPVPTPPVEPPVVPTPTPITPPVIKKPIWWNAMLAWLRRHNMKVVKK